MRIRPVTACLVLGAGLAWAGPRAWSGEPAGAVAPDTGPAIVAPESGGETGASPGIIPGPALPSAENKTTDAPVAGKAAAEEKEPVPRYRFSASGDGFVRLDSQTGEVSYCAPRTAGWACQPAADERAALEAEVARLADANVALKRELSMQQALPHPHSPGPESAPSESPPKESRPKEFPPKAAPETPPKGYRLPEGALRLPTNEDIDRAVTFAGKVWKRLVDMLNDIQKDAREKI